MNIDVVCESSGSVLEQEGHTFTDRGVGVRGREMDGAHRAFDCKRPRGRLFYTACFSPPRTARLCILDFMLQSPLPRPPCAWRLVFLNLSFHGHNELEFFKVGTVS